MTKQKKVIETVIEGISHRQLINDLIVLNKRLSMIEEKFDITPRKTELFVWIIRPTDKPYNGLNLPDVSGWEPHFSYQTIFRQLNLSVKEDDELKFVDPYYLVPLLDEQKIVFTETGWWLDAGDENLHQHRVTNPDVLSNLNRLLLSCLKKNNGVLENYGLTSVGYCIKRTKVRAIIELAEHIVNEGGNIDMTAYDLLSKFNNKDCFELLMEDQTLTFKLANVVIDNLTKIIVAVDQK